MTIEEKAKAYDEAIERANSLLSSNELGNAWIYKILPELKESEDERILKQLRDFFKNHINSVYEEIDDNNDVLAWLEKQGNINPTEDELEALRIAAYEPTKNWSEKLQSLYEKLTHCDQKPVFEMKSAEESLGIDSDTYNKIVDECIFGEQKSDDVEEVNFFDDFRKTDSEVEPKFKVEKDKWYVCTSQYCNCIEGRNYKASLDGRIIDDYGTEYDMHDDAYRWFRPWTIQDAKAGDVLAWDDSKCIAIFKNIYDENSFNSYGFVGGCTDSFESRQSYHDIEGAHPATKEQRDLLFQKIKEAGYEWDAEKKELKKIEQIPAELGENRSKELSLSLQIQAYLNTASDELYAEGKPLYSEERIEDIHKCMLMWQKLHNAYFYQKPTWSEEDIKTLNRISTILVNASEIKNWWKEYRLIEREEMIRLTDFLKSFIDRVQPCASAMIEVSIVV